MNLDWRELLLATLCFSEMLKLSDRRVLYYKKRCVVPYRSPWGIRIVFQIVGPRLSMFFCVRSQWSNQIAEPEELLSFIKELINTYIPCLSFSWSNLTVQISASLFSVSVVACMQKAYSNVTE